MTRGAKSQAKSATVHMPVHSTSTQAFAALLTQLIKHLLFVRGQLPILYDKLLQHEMAAQKAAASSNPRPRRGGRDGRRRAKFLEESESLFRAVAAPALFSPTDTTTVFLLLGASTSTPREAYEFIFPPTSTVGDLENAKNEAVMTNSNKNDEAMVQAVCRMALREFAVRTFDLPEGTAPERRCKAFLLFETGGVAAEQQQSILQGFNLRREWKLRMSSLKRCTHTRVVLHEASNFDDSHEDEFRTLDVAQNDTGHQRVWLQSTAKLQGLVRPEGKNE